MNVYERSRTSKRECGGRLDTNLGQETQKALVLAKDGMAEQLVEVALNLLATPLELVAHHSPGARAEQLLRRLLGLLRVDRRARGQRRNNEPVYPVARRHAVL